MHREFWRLLKVNIFTESKNIFFSNYERVYVKKQRSNRIGIIKLSEMNLYSEEQYDNKSNRK